MKPYCVFLLILLFTAPSFSQEKTTGSKDPQNMRIEPENTDCHQLPERFEDLSQALEALEKTRFYYDQSVKTTRRSGLMSARFVSCDFKAGYLVIRIDSMDQVYPNVEKGIWDQFQQTADIDGFYYKHIANLPKLQSP